MLKSRPHSINDKQCERQAQERMAAALNVIGNWLEDMVEVLQGQQSPL